MILQQDSSASNLLPPDHSSRRPWASAPSLQARGPGAVIPESRYSNPSGRVRASDRPKPCGSPIKRLSGEQALLYS